MKIALDDYNKLEIVLVSRTAELRRKDDFLLKKYVYAVASLKKKFDYLLSFPYIEGSGEPLELLFINDLYEGVITKEFKDAVPFSKGTDFSIEEKCNASIDIDKQLSILHSYNMCFNDIHSDNLLIDKNGGHLIDFDEIDYVGGTSYTPKYKLGNSDGNVFSSSEKVDLYKALLCYLSLFYNLDIESKVKFSSILDISRVPLLFDKTTIINLINDATVAMFSFDFKFPNIEEFLPFVLDEDKYNFDLKKIKENVKVLR